MIGISALDLMSTWELIQITWKNMIIQIPEPTPLQTSLKTRTSINPRYRCKMKGFRKPTKSEIIRDQKEVINNLLQLVALQKKFIDSE